MEINGDALKTAMLCFKENFRFFLCVYLNLSESILLECIESKSLSGEGSKDGYCAELHCYGVVSGARIFTHTAASQLAWT